MTLGGYAHRIQVRLSLVHSDIGHCSSYALACDKPVPSFFFIRVCYPLCGTEVGSFGAGHLRRNPLLCHIPSIPHVTLSVLANRMLLFLWNRALFSILIAHIF
jgi:hypothetical protein